MAGAAATKPATERTIEVGDSSIRASEIASVFYGAQDVSPPFDVRWEYWGRVVLKSGKTIDCTRVRAEEVVRLLDEQATPLTWRWRFEDRSRWDRRYFSADLVEAATRHRFLVAGQWYELPYWRRQSYANLVRKTFRGRDPKPVKIPTQEGMLTCNSEAIEGYAGHDKEGYGQVSIGGEVFTTRIKAMTRRLEVAAERAAKDAFAESWGRSRGRPPLLSKGRPNVGGVAR